jgi:hypothetical protein
MAVLMVHRHSQGADDTSNHELPWFDCLVSQRRRQQVRGLATPLKKVTMTRDDRRASSRFT